VKLQQIVASKIKVVLGSTTIIELWECKIMKANHMQYKYNIHVCIATCADEE